MLESRFAFSSYRDEASGGWGPWLVPFSPPQILRRPDEALVGSGLLQDDILIKFIMIYTSIAQWLF